MSSQGSELKDAEKMYLRVIQGFEKALGDDYPTKWRATRFLALLYSAQDRLAEAEDLLKRARLWFEKTLGLEHFSTLRAIRHMLEVYRKMGKTR